MNLKEKIAIDNLLLKLEGVEDLPKKLYVLGHKIEQNVGRLIKSKQGFRYLSWDVYEYILQTIDPEHFFWVSHADQFRVEITMTWLGKEYKGSYGVKTSPNKKDGTPLKSVSERTIDDGMRCYAKLASRVTQFMMHLWREGDNV